MALTEIQRYTFYISSSQRNTGSNTNFNINLNRVLNLVSKRGRFALVMHSITVPFSFYQLDTTMNTLSVRVSDGTNLKTGTITLTTGNYTATTVLTELSNKLTSFAQASSGSYVGYTPLFAFSYSQSTGLSTLIMKFGNPINLYFSTNTTLGQFFGFTTDQILSLASTPVSTSIVVTNPVYLLYLRSNNLVQFNNKEFIVSKDTTSSIIYRIPVMTQVQTYIHHISNSDPFFISNNSIDTINFYLTTNLSITDLNLQGLPFQFKFSIIEYLFPEYEPLEQMVYKTSSPIAQDQVQKLKDEYTKALEDISRYKSKLLESTDKLKERIKSKETPES